MSVPLKGIATASGFALFVGSLFYLSTRNYLLFHTIIESLSIIIAFSIFVVAWNTRWFLENQFLLFLGLIYPFVGILDFMHAISYKGMGVIEGYGANLPTQLWIQARYLESISILIAALLINRKVRVTLVMFLYTAVTGLLLLSLFIWKIFPDCFLEPGGLTTFKISSEYIICIILAGSLIVVVREKDYFDRRTFSYLVASIISTIAAELAFTFYVSVYGLSNMVGHLFKFLSFYLIYKGLIAVGLRDPYSLMFMNLKRSEENLRQTRNELRSKNEELESFLYAAGHDLRTPLTSALGYTQLLKRKVTGIATFEGGDMLNKIHSSLKHLNLILKDLLDFAHLGYHTATIVQVDVMELTEQIADEKREDIARLGAKVTVHGPLPALRMSKTRAYQVFMNLITNSLKFSRESVPLHIEIGVSETVYTDTTELTQFFVSDNGLGMEGEIREKAFELFYTSEKSSGENTGAGLAIVKRIVEKGGGNIWIESVPGEGTTFHFTMPVVE